MDPAPVVLLVFLLLAVATVAISVVVQQYSANEPPYLGHPDQLGDVGTRRRSGDDVRVPGDADWDTRDQLGHDDGPLARETEYRRARAEELEAVARRERQYADRAEAEAQRLRERDDNAGPEPTAQRARRRRAGVAPEDLDY